MKLGTLFEDALKEAHIELTTGTELKIKVKKEKGHLYLVVDDVSKFEREILSRSKKVTGKETPYHPALTSGERIRALRLGLGLTLNDLAKKADMSKGSLCSIEKGTRSIGLQVMRKLAAAMGLRLEDLAA